jgi:cholesterol oxidase
MYPRAFLPISRRMFVRTAAVGAAAVGTLGLSGCDGGPASERVDTLILGSGFGGSITALRLAQAGHRSVVLERGRRWTIHTPGEDVFSSMRPGDIDMRSTWLAEQQPLPGIPAGRRMALYTGVLEKIYGNGIDIVCAAGVGGGSLVYSGMMVQPPRDFFEEVFPDEISYDDMDTRWYPMVRAMMNPGMLPDELINRPEWTATRLFLEQAQNAGYEARRLLCAFDFEAAAREVAEMDAIPQMLSLGSYIFGLNSGAKATLDKSYLGMAEMTGLCEVRPLHWAQVIRQHAEGYSVVVHQIDEMGNVLAEKEIIARRLFVSCGTANTNGILLRSQAENGLPDLPEEIGSGFGNNGQHIKARTGVVPDAAAAGFGSTQAGPACAMLFDPDNRIAMENGPAPIAGATLIGTGQGIPSGRGRFRWDATAGKVTVDWEASYDAQAAEAATNIIARLNEVNGGEPASLGLDVSITFHPLGGCVHGQGTDMFGRVNGHPNLYVVDGSLLPGVTPLSNPFWTVSANAERCIETIVREDFGASV